MPEAGAADEFGMLHLKCRIALSSDRYIIYTIEETGLILSSKIVPPTAQNLKCVEDDLWHYLPQVISMQRDAPVEETTWRAKQAIRNYDPCISCVTHFLKVRVTREE